MTDPALLPAARLAEIEALSQPQYRSDGAVGSGAKYRVALRALLAHIAALQAQLDFARGELELIHGKKWSVIELALADQEAEKLWCELRDVKSFAEAYRKLEASLAETRERLKEADAVVAAISQRGSFASLPGEKLLSWRDDAIARHRQRMTETEEAVTASPPDAQSTDDPKPRHVE